MLRRLHRIAIVLVIGGLLSPACVHQLTMRAKDGEVLRGRWRLARAGTGLIQVATGQGETLVGVLTPIARHAFFETYQAVFGRGAIAAENADISAHGQGFWVLPGTTNAIGDVVYGEIFGMDGAQAVSGPLLYWTAQLESDRRTSMRCFLIGSTHGNRGLGRCKSSGGKEYTVQF